MGALSAAVCAGDLLKEVAIIFIMEGRQCSAVQREGSELGRG